ncbi:MAG: hypothetical protein PHQ66_00120 [Candidatus Nanoarchaeia archaeon]|nr:hypothetical protein [Candidatus Nanoarchaeia archaeon]MDD5358147.1 hypothetical protein [Candidatus Nanoarchaeia archaeon]MDD5589334.1 hypothetical protein [Candidatus Nanoarchaeia archaeon]
MIISRTPLNLNFCGEETNIKEYWEKHDGAIICGTINKYIYLIAKERIDNEIWLKYSKNEIVKRLDEIKNELLKEVLKETGFIKGIELVSLSSIPKGYELGSSSAFTIGSLNSVYALLGKYKSPLELAKEAIEIERKARGLNSKRNEQYSLSYGGLNFIELKKDGEIKISPIIMPPSIKKSLTDNLLLFDMGIKENPQDEILKEKPIDEESLHKAKEFAYALKDSLQSLDIRRFGEILHQNWVYKKTKEEIHPAIEWNYNLAKSAGAVGGKVWNCKNGRFLLLYVEPENQDRVRAALGNLNEIHFNLESSGSKIIYLEDI